MVTDHSTRDLKEWYGTIETALQSMTPHELEMIICETARLDKLSCIPDKGVTRGVAAKALADELRRRGT